MNNSQADAKIIVLAWPDVFVSGVDGFYEPLFKSLGIQHSGKYKAGHAALVLINNETGHCEFFDFGRYITPDGKGRVRGAKTDPEVAVPIKAKIQDNRVTNLEEILLWLDANEKITHGEGRMIASVCQEVSYKAAKSFVEKEQNKGSWRYSPFHLIATNCSRFVADVCRAGSLNKWIKVKNAVRITFTPSPLGNVYNSRSSPKMYRVQNGKISTYPARLSNVLRDVLLGFLDKPSTNGDFCLIGTVEEPDRPSSLEPTAVWLGGKGAGVWFQQNPNTVLPDNLMAIQRISAEGTLDFERNYSLPEGFNKKETFQFVYDCNAHYCTVNQGENQYRLDVVKEPQHVLSSANR